MQQPHLYTSLQIKIDRVKSKIKPTLLVATAFTLLPFLWISFFHAIFKEDGPAYRWVFLWSFLGFHVFICGSQLAISLIALAKGNPIPGFFKNLKTPNSRDESSTPMNKTEYYKKAFESLCNRRKKIAEIKSANLNFMLCDGKIAPCGYKCLRLTEDLQSRLKLYKVPPQPSLRKYEYFISKSATEVTRESIMKRLEEQDPKEYARLYPPHRRSNLTRMKGQNCSCDEDAKSLWGCDDDILYEVLEIPAARVEGRLFSNQQYDETIDMRETPKVNYKQLEDDNKLMSWREGVKGVLHIGKIEIGLTSSP